MIFKTEWGRLVKCYSILASIGGYLDFIRPFGPILASFGLDFGASEQRFQPDIQVLARMGILEGIRT